MIDCSCTKVPYGDTEVLLPESLEECAVHGPEAPRRGQWWRHYKGGVYEVVGLAESKTDTLGWTVNGQASKVRWLVVYHLIGKPDEVCVRALDEWGRHVPRCYSDHDHDVHAKGACDGCGSREVEPYRPRFERTVRGPHEFVPDPAGQGCLVCREGVMFYEHDG